MKIKILAIILILAVALTGIGMTPAMVLADTETPTPPTPTATQPAYCESRLIRIESNQVLSCTAGPHATCGVESVYTNVSAAWEIPLLSDTGHTITYNFTETGAGWPDAANQIAVRARSYDELGNQDGDWIDWFTDGSTFNLVVGDQTGKPPKQYHQINITLGAGHDETYTAEVVLNYIEGWTVPGYCDDGDDDDDDGGGKNLLEDGDMEMWNGFGVETPWQKLYTGMRDGYQYYDMWGVPKYTDWGFGRLNYQKFGLLRWYFAYPQLNFRAACDSGMQQIGNQQHRLIAGWATGIQQDFDWDGGVMYWKFKGRDGLASDFGDFPAAQPNIFLISLSGTPTVYPLFNGTLGYDWATYMGEIDLPAGAYRIIFDQSYNTPDDSLGAAYYIDDVAVDDEPLSAECSESEDPQPTVTPTTGASPTPGTSTPTATRSVTPTVATQVPTSWIFTPTARTMEMIPIPNCGFEQGQVGWGWSVPTGLSLVGGPVGPTYAISNALSNGVTTSFYLSEYADTYLVIYARGNVKIEAVHLQTSNRYLLQTGNYTNWTQLYINRLLPAGNYRLELNSTSSALGAAYDGVVMAKWGWPSSSWCLATPTPGPTAFTTGTPTATRIPTQTGTPAPTRTQYATWTAAATSTPHTRTPDPNYTLTPGWELTATAMAGTPGTGDGDFPWDWGDDPPQQPDWGWDADCIRPDGWWQVGWWFEWEFCRLGAWFSWGPPNNQQISDFTGTLTEKEPFGTINEIRDAYQALNDELSLYDWTVTGLPGTTDLADPALFLQPGPSLWFGDEYYIMGSGTIYNTNCNAQLVTMIGPQLSKGTCFIFDVLYQNGLMPWLQLFIDFSSLFTLIYYVWKKFVEKAA